jgi:sodium/potassium-transporting ATPase subunit alpha
MEKDNEKVVPDDSIVEVTKTQTAGDHRIQFIPAVKPERERPTGRDDDGSTFVPPSRRSQSVGSITRRPQSIVSLPPVLSKKQKARLKHEKEEEKKHVDITEHLMAHEDVAERYNTRINMKAPGESLGLKSEQAAQLLLEHGPNILTPPSKRHWILKYWDCLKSLFNLLLILAGCLEYILLGINYKENFQNVSIHQFRPWQMVQGQTYLELYLWLLPDLFGSHSHFGCIHQCLHRVLPAAKVASTFGVIPQYDSSKVHVYSRWQVSTA